MFGFWFGLERICLHFFPKEKSGWNCKKKARGDRKIRREARASARPKLFIARGGRKDGDVRTRHGVARPRRRREHVPPSISLLAANLALAVAVQLAIIDEQARCRFARNLLSHLPK